MKPLVDSRKCVSFTIAAFWQGLSDHWPERQQEEFLGPFVHRMIGRRIPWDHEEKLGWLMVDWIVHHYVPAWLDLSGEGALAGVLRALPEVSSVGTWEQIQSTVQSANLAGAAAWNRAERSASAEAFSAARKAGWVAVDATGGDSFWNVAWELQRQYTWGADEAMQAATLAMRVASRAAQAAAVTAKEELARTIAVLQQSVCGLLDRMLREATRRNGGGE